MTEMDFVLRFVAIWAEYPLRSQKVAALLYLCFQCFSQVFVSIVKKELGILQATQGDIHNKTQKKAQGVDTLLKVKLSPQKKEKHK